jgi:hypothetical protein
MHLAIDMVLHSLGPEVVSVIVPHAGIDDHSTTTLANLALEKMELEIRVSDNEVDTARKVE